MMTSLQRVSHTGKLEAKSGAFESSFAAGLDLSEFGLPSKMHESATADWQQGWNEARPSQSYCF